MRGVPQNSPLFFPPKNGGQRGLEPRSDERAGCCASGIVRDGEPGRRRLSVTVGTKEDGTAARPWYCTLILCAVELIINCHSLDSKTGSTGSRPASENGGGAAGVPWRPHSSANSGFSRRTSYGERLLLSLTRPNSAARTFRKSCCLSTSQWANGTIGAGIDPTQ